MADPDLLIVGGSVRAAAWCAVRAGLKVAALDRYNDLDLRAVAEPCFLWDGSDEQAERVVGELGVPWMYTGPLENRPDLIDRCAALAPLRGTSGEPLRRVRDPFELHAALTAFAAPRKHEPKNLRVLDVRPSHDPPPFVPPGWQCDARLFTTDEAPWLLKPLQSCGGFGIAVWDEAAVDHPTRRRPHYFQRIVSTGRPCTPLGVSAEALEDGVRLLGICRNGGVQLLGVEPPSFRNEAMIGPVNGGGPADLLEHLREWFGLRGLFGVDVVSYSGPHDSWAVVEVNPRFCASMDLLDGPFGSPSGPFGTASLRDAGPAAPRRRVRRRVRRTVVAEEDVIVGDLPVFGPFDDGWVADVPAPGTLVPKERPVCSVYADDDPTGEPGRAGIARNLARVRAALEPA